MTLLCLKYKLHITIVAIDCTIFVLPYIWEIVVFYDTHVYLGHPLQFDIILKFHSRRIGPLKLLNSLNGPYCSCISKGTSLLYIIDAISLRMFER